jgi:hypothetical protein
VKALLTLLFAGIFVIMVSVTIRASLAIGLWEAWPGYAANPWAVATLYDAYSGFLLFFGYVAWRERSIWSRALWFVLIMGLGNMATSAYLLLQIARLRPGEPVSAILGTRQAEAVR